MGYHQQFYGDKSVPEKQAVRACYRIKLKTPLKLGLAPMAPRQITGAEALAAFKAYKMEHDHAEDQVNALKNIYRRAVQYSAAYSEPEKLAIKRYVDLVEGIVKYPYSTIAETGAGHRAN